MPKYPKGEYPKETLQYFAGDYSALDTSWDISYVRMAAMAYLMDKHGVDLKVAAATAANADTEAGGPFFWDPTVLGDKGKAFGLFQWHPDRQAAFYEFAKVLGKDPEQRTTQLDFAMQEIGLYVDAAGHDPTKLPGYMQRGWAKKHIVNAPSVRSASAMFSKYFEGPKEVEKNMVNRGYKAVTFASDFIGAPVNQEELDWHKQALANIAEDKAKAEAKAAEELALLEAKMIDPGEVVNRPLEERISG